MSGTLIDKYKRETKICVMENESHQPKLAQVMAMINPYASSVISTTFISSMILYIMFQTCYACSADSANTILEEDLVFL